MIGWVDLGGSGLVGAGLERSGRTHAVLHDPRDVVRALGDAALDALVVESDGLQAEARDLIAAARAQGVPSLLVTRDRSVSAAVDALRLGASDCLVAPFELESLERALDRLGDAGRTPSARHDGAFVTRDEELRATLDLAASVAASDATILIEGESGTGKELIAQLVHRASPRGDRELVSVNCAALPAGLLESELFGHERGSFTGAIARSIGKFELAHGTTILLDEIGELELGLQAKLLRVIQEKQVQRVGASRPVSVDFRLIATTNRSLAQEARAGRFREDLYYRLNVLPIRVKPLRDRPGDVAVLLEHFFAGHRAAGRDLPRLDAASRAVLASYAWPGNVRELENLAERLVLTHGGRDVHADELGLGLVALPHAATQPPAGEAPPFETIRDMERWLIVRTLESMDGNRTRASRRLGISLRTLRNKIREYEIDEPQTLPRTGLARARPARGHDLPGDR